MGTLVNNVIIEYNRGDNILVKIFWPTIFDDLTIKTNKINAC